MASAMTGRGRYRGRMGYLVVGFARLIMMQIALDVTNHRRTVPVSCQGNRRRSGAMTDVLVRIAG